MLSLFFGAGFSKWSANLPLADELFDFCIGPWGNRELSKLQLVKAHKHHWDKIHRNGISEQFILDALNYSERDRESVIWYVTRRISEPFIWKEYHAGRWRRHVLMIDENRRLDIEGVKKAAKFLKDCIRVPVTGIVTTNYDLLLEYALGTKEFNYGIPNQPLIGRGPYPVYNWAKGNVRLKGKIKLAKVHGSINLDDKGHYTDGRRGITGNAKIVPPTAGKQTPKNLQFELQLAHDIIASSTRLLVFGFRFNPYDKAILNLLKDAGKNLNSILIIDLLSKFEPARALWPNSNIITCLPPPNGEVEIIRWIHKTPGKLDSYLKG